MKQCPDQNQNTFIESRLDRRVSVMALLVVCTFLTVGCSSQIRLPWDSDPLDADRVMTVEPLEIPPDLDVLPTPGQAKHAAQNTVPDPTVTSAANILFDAPRRVESKPLTRNEREKLPDWMTKP
jgi:hypothetical protein